MLQQDRAIHKAHEFKCLFVCLGGRQGEADRLNCNPLQRVGIPFFRDLVCGGAIQYVFL